MSRTRSCLLVFFLARELRDWSLERDREVSRTESCVWPGGQAGRSVCWAVWPESCFFSFFFLFVILVVNNVNFENFGGVF